MRPFFLAAIASVCVSTSAGAARGEAAPKPPSPRAYAYAVIGVEDLALALDLWNGRFGMEILRRETGPDAQLARAWGLPDNAIADQAVLRAPGTLNGGVLLVQFATPANAVRQDARPSDLAPQSVVIAVRDLEARYGELATDPGRFASRVVRRTVDRTPVRELHMDTHDALDIVFREPVRKPETVGKQGYGAALAVVLTTSDVAREAAFFREVLGLETIGNEQGEVLVLGDRKGRFGRLELTQSGGSQARDLYARTVPPARGLISLAYVVPDLKPIVAAGRSAGLAEHGRVVSILGDGHMASVASPSGLRIDILQP
jgi:catechol 2,3-dioxygenase-like lactoylglutathione lyase family enzyme